MDKVEFVKDFSEFYVEMRKEGIETVADLTTLYAIYRKDLRADRLNNRRQSNPGKEKATDRQKHFLMDLAYKNGVCVTQKELDKMTRAQASKTITTLLGGD